MRLCGNLGRTRLRRFATMLVRGWRRAEIGLHFRRFATFPQRRTRHPFHSTMASGVTDHVWSLEEIAALLD